MKKNTYKYNVCKLNLKLNGEEKHTKHSQTHTLNLLKP